MAVRREGDDRHDGFALVAVLAVTGLLAGFLVTMSFWARNSVETAAVATFDAETDALLRAGVDIAGFGLFVQGAPVSAIDGQQLVLDAGKVAISVTDDGDKIDLNGSSAALLAIAYRAAGLHAMPPDTFAARVMDWRDADGRPNKNGAEEGEYRKAGLPGPRNGPFHNVSDLGWVLDVSAADLAAIRPFVTILNPGGKLDPYRTPRAVLSILPGMKKEILEQSLSIRESGPGPEAMARLGSVLEPQTSYLEFGSPVVFEVNLQVSPNHDRRRKNSRVVMIRSYDSRAPYRIVEWNEDQ